MSTKFKSNVGTFPNVSGLQQIPPGATSIPQSYLNGVGRTVDRGTVKFSGTSVFQQLAGGTLLGELEPASTSNVFTYLHPFKVIYVGGETAAQKGNVRVAILEGHILGRVNFDPYGDWWGSLDGDTRQFAQSTLGMPGLSIDPKTVDPGAKPDPAKGKTPQKPGDTKNDATKNGASTFFTNPINATAANNTLRNNHFQFDGGDSFYTSRQGYLSGNPGNQEGGVGWSGSTFFTPAGGNYGGNSSTFITGPNRPGGGVYLPPANLGNE